MPKPTQPSHNESSLHPAWTDTAKNLQGRLVASVELLPKDVKTFKDLEAHVRGILQGAIKDGRLKVDQHTVWTLLKPCETPSSRLKKELQKVGEQLRILLGGGNSDGTRFSEKPEMTPHFPLDDGSRMDFSITVRESKNGIKLEGFIFSLSFPDSPRTATGPRFLRLDMNLSNHRNDQDGLRVHLHPGSNDLQVPVPWMSPEEVLKFFLYGLRLPENPQHDQA